MFFCVLVLVLDTGLGLGLGLGLDLSFYLVRLVFLLEACWSVHTYCCFAAPFGAPLSS